MLYASNTFSCFVEFSSAFFLFSAICRVFLRELAIKIITLYRGNYLNTTWECVCVYLRSILIKDEISLQIKYIAWSQLMPTRKGRTRENVWWEKPIYPHKNIYDIVSVSSQRRTKEFRQRVWSILLSIATYISVDNNKLLFN